MTRPKNDAQITFRLTSAEKRDIIAAADRRDRSHNWLVRMIVSTWLKRETRRRHRSKEK